MFELFFDPRIESSRSNNPQYHVSKASISVTFGQKWMSKLDIFSANVLGPFAVALLFWQADAVY
jgi:hypothetical protein